MTVTEACIWKCGNNIDTDQIIASQYLLLPTIDDMKRFAFETVYENFAGRMSPGDVIVAGRNFGCGSSREQAPAVLKALSVSAIIARSFSRIFFRNAINIGLPLIMCDDIYERTTEGERLRFSLQDGKIWYGEGQYEFPKFPPHLLKIIESGGLIPYLNKKQEVR